MLNIEEFDVVGEKIIEWVIMFVVEFYFVFNVMKEVVELKKLNFNFMKVGFIDDLIIDCYLIIYFDVRFELFWLVEYSIEI